MKYQLTFGRNSQLIWALIVPAFILLIPLLISIEFILPNFPKSDLILIVTTVLYMGGTLWLTLKWVKATTAPVEIFINNGVIHFHFQKKNIFHKTDFSLAYSDINNIGEDSDKGFDFLYFECNHPNYNRFHITSNEGNEEFTAFKYQIFEKETDFNTNTIPNNPITHKSIYQKWPMKILAMIFFICWFIFPLALAYNTLDWLYNIKYWIFVIMSSPIIFKVYTQNFQRKTNT